MPTVSYTPDQITQINNAKGAVAAAETAVTSAQNNVNANYTAMAIAFDAGALSPKDCYNKPPTLTSQLSIGNMNRQSCKLSIVTDLPKCPKCHDAVDAFNQAYKIWLDSKSGVTSANAALQTAKDNLKNLLDSIANQNSNDPGIIQANQVAVAEATAAQKKEQSKWILFGLIALAIVIAALFFAKMLLGHKS